MWVCFKSDHAEEADFVHVIKATDFVEIILDYPDEPKANHTSHQSGQSNKWGVLILEDK